MRHLDMLALIAEVFADVDTFTILQCQSCGSESEDEDDLCCDDPNIQSVSLDQDGEELYGGF